MTLLSEYLYCIIRCSEERNYDGVIPIGGHNGPVRAIPYRGLAVVVSATPTTHYDCTRVNMLTHERVQERISQEFTLLPVRFGTVANASNPAQNIQKLLQSRFQEFDRLLKELEGKAELGIKALWRDENALFEEILAHNEGIRKLRDSLKGRPLEAIRFDRIRLGEMVKEALDRRRAIEAKDILAPLKRVASRTVENPVVADRVIVNAAFLVDKNLEGEFDQVVKRLDEELGRRVVFKYVGPAPPYNFVNITVNWEEL